MSMERATSQCSQCSQWFTYGIDYARGGNLYLDRQGHPAEIMHDVNFCRKHGRERDAARATRLRIVTAALKKLTPKERAVFRPMIRHFEDWH